MNASTRRFARHYLEMVVVMFIGMAALWAPATLALSAAGMSSSELQSDAPALLLLVMAITMTAPMVAWMRYRGHGWPATAEMAAAMFVPAFGAIALLWVGLVDDLGALLVLEHVAMLLGMLVAMLLRRDEYSSGAHGHGRARRQMPSPVSRQPSPGPRRP